MNPADLGKIFEMNPAAFWQAQQMLKQQSQGVDLENQRRSAELSQLQQMNPLLLEQQRLRNQGFSLGNLMDEARLPGVKADAASKQRQWDIESQVPVEQQLKLKLSEMATKMSDNEWKQTENGIRQLMTSPSANERRMGEVLFKSMPDMVKARELAANKEELERIKANARKEAEDARSQRALALVRARGEEARKQLEVKKDPKTYQEAAVKFRNMADAVEDDAVRNELLAKANEFERAAIALAQARSAGQIDVGAATGMPTKEVNPQLGGGSKPGSSKDNPIVLK